MIILDSSESKAFINDKSHAAPMIISVFDRVENMVRKGKLVGDKCFLLLTLS